jgi:hypothetical protein
MGQRTEAERLVHEAKIAVAALFLSKEVSAVQQGLAGYRTLMKQLSSPSPYGTQCQRVLQGTPYRDLTFNYDRLFELAFRQYFPEDSSLDLYGKGVLNTGLSWLPGSPLDVDLSRFSFLKLHGSVNLYHFEEVQGFKQLRV